MKLIFLCFSILSQFAYGQQQVPFKQPRSIGWKYFSQERLTEDQFKDRVCNILPSIEGWCSKEKALHFIDLVLQEKPNVCVEIGVFGGASLFPVASALQFLEKGVIIAIDPWDNQECVKGYDPLHESIDYQWWGNVDLESMHRTYLDLIQRYKFENQVFTLKMNSQQAEDSVGEIDILYLDGNHGELISTQDVISYLPKVKPGGYVWVNSCFDQRKQKALDIILNDCDLVKFIEKGNCMLFRKRDL